MMLSLPRRRLIPKWRSISATLTKLESTSIERNDVKLFLGDEEGLDKAIALWRDSKSPGFLGEVLSFSIHENLTTKIREIANEAIKSNAAATPVQRRFMHDFSRDLIGGYSSQLLNDSSISQGYPYQAHVSKLRSLLRAAPENVFALLDYAQFQAAAGKIISAERAIITARELAPNNRIVLRTAARFYVHARNPEFAHSLIKLHSRTPGDPWLMASEISLADAINVKPHFLSKGKRFILDQRNMSPAHMTELAGSIAIEEINSGSLRLAREHQRKALLAPNDNVIAQAIGQADLFGIHLDSPVVQGALSASNEALMLRSWINLEPEMVEIYAQKWHMEEPFSSRPIVMLSTLYANRGDFDRAYQWVRIGLISDPHDMGLLTNLAYIQARKGNINDSRGAIRALKHLNFGLANAFADANEGLLAYMQGVYEVGDGYYDAALDFLEKKKLPNVAAYCAINQALAALDFQHPNVADVIKRANQYILSYPSYDSAMLLKLRTASEIEQVSVPEVRKRRVSQWIYDPNKNTLTERVGLTGSGAQSLVILDRKPS